MSISGSTSSTFYTCTSGNCSSNYRLSPFSLKHRNFLSNLPSTSNLTAVLSSDPAQDKSYFGSKALINFSCDVLSAGHCVLNQDGK